MTGYNKGVIIYFSGKITFNKRGDKMSDKKEENDIRTEKINCYVTKVEFEKIKGVCDANGISLSGYVRMAVLNSFDKLGLLKGKE